MRPPAVPTPITTPAQAEAVVIQAVDFQAVAVADTPAEVIQVAAVAAIEDKSNPFKRKLL